MRSRRRSTFLSIWQLEPLARILAFGFVATAPWFIRAGSWLLRDESVTPARQVRAAAPIAKVAFAVFALSAGAALTWWASAYLPGRAIWEARANIGLDLGLFVMVLYLPLHVLAFYIQRPESRTRVGMCVALALTAFAIGATLPIGQRTNALLPVLLLLMFWRTPTLRAISAGAMALFVSAALLLPLFKWQFAGENSVPTSELIVSTFNSDLGRTPVLTEAIGRSPFLGTEVMPYPGAGYVYTALFFVPRALLPEKGFATAIEFTAAVVNEPAALVNWRFGVGVVEELMLNFGTLAVPIGLAVVGLGVAAGSRAARRLPALRVPLRLAALWSFGYDSASLLLTFGVMATMCIALDGVMRVLSFTPSPSTRSGVRRTAVSSPLVVREG